MATRSEQYRANEQRHPSKKPKRAKHGKRRVDAKEPSRAKDHAGRKATYALEDTGPGKRPSRKSSRKSANRAKADTTFNLVEEMRKGSPKSRFEKASAQATRARSSRGGTP